MAKSNLSWDLVDSKLTVTILATSKKLTFDLAEIYPDFAKMTDVQQKLAVYGLKQKLADRLARTADMKLTPVEMEAELMALWKQLVDGIWRIAGEGRSSKLQTAWDKADVAEKKVLEKLGLKPVSK